MQHLTPQQHVHLAKVAQGEEYADLCLRGGQIVDCLGRRIEQCDVAISSGRIAALGTGFKAKKELDCSGLFICPGFIDAHIHIESTMLIPREFARAVVPRGTIGVVADPHEIANCLGILGVEYMLEASKGLPMSFFYTAPSCVPATHLETSGASLGPEDIQTLLNMDRVVALGEMMNFPGVIMGLEDVESKLAIAREMNKPIDGHAPGLSGSGLCAYIGAGIDSDHECTTAQEAREKLALGMYLFLRQGTSEENLLDLLPAVNPHNLYRCCLVSDDRHPHDLMEKGHLDHSLRLAIEGGLDPLDALQMVTINPAKRFGLRYLGGLIPGYFADLVLLKGLEGVEVVGTLYRGELVASEGAMVDLAEKGGSSAVVGSSMNVPLDRLDFSIKAQGEQARVIGIQPGQIVTDHLILPIKRQGEEAVSDPDRDILKIAVVERHHGTGNVGLGFIQGLGIKRGAIASSVSHDSHNIIVAGADDNSMRMAVKTLVQGGGGLCAVQDDKVLEYLPLPVAGLMSDRPLGEVRRLADRVVEVAREMGSNLINPFMTLSFLALPVIPRLKLTDIGLVDVEKFMVVSLFV